MCHNLNTSFSVDKWSARFMCKKMQDKIGSEIGPAQGLRRLFASSFNRVTLLPNQLRIILSGSSQAIHLYQNRKSSKFFKTPDSNGQYRYSTPGLQAFIRLVSYKKHTTILLKMIALCTRLCKASIISAAPQKSLLMIENWSADIKRAFASFQLNFGWVCFLVTKL